uniref:ETS transcription factor ELK3 n=2 Tax=Falco TaxID=8952 RepID=A0A8C4TU90_FALTI
MSRRSRILQSMRGPAWEGAPARSGSKGAPPARGHPRLSPQPGGARRPPLPGPAPRPGPSPCAGRTERRSRAPRKHLPTGSRGQAGTVPPRRCGRLVAVCRRWAQRRAGGKLLPRGVAQEEVEVGGAAGAPCEPLELPLPVLLCVCLVLQPCCTSVARARGEGRKSLFTQTANRLGNNAGKEVSRLCLTALTSCSLSHGHTHTHTLRPKKKKGGGESGSHYKSNRALAEDCQHGEPGDFTQLPLNYQERAEKSLSRWNIIKKVIGQKFVYKFVSFPEILKMDPHAVEISRESLLLQDSDCKMPSESRDQHKHSLSALKSTSRNEYIHSGLYSSFTINSLQNQPDPYKPIKTEKLEEKSEGNTPVEEVRTVIRFVTNKTDKQVMRPMVSLPSTSETAAASAFLSSSVSAKISSLMLPNSASISSPSSSSSRSPSLSPTSPLPAEHRSLFLESSCYDSDSLEPLNLSSGSKAKSPSLPPKAKKPKGLEISAPPMVLSSTDIGSIALNSPALPSGSLTPAFFTAQTPNGLLLTPSPLLSSIHFWSSLSPVAPLSPARLQGPNTLFQFPTLLNGHIPVPLPSLDGASSPVLLSPNAQKS